ncbi:MAG: TonB-dependent receptor [Halioglobus sp.]|nr:TonB-dependent receptor [Halioglobus sp.]
MVTTQRLAGSAAVLFLFSGSAVVAQQPAAAVEAARGVLEEVLVTATRRESSLQEVPLSVTALDGETLEKLKFFEFEDFADAVPGLSMTNSAGEPGVIAVRGVGFAPNSSAAPAVDIYWNELPIPAVYAFNSIFDLQQMELLRGPQGTLRGRPAPAGAITITTRQPELDNVNGAVTGSFSDQDARNIDAAINVPIIEDALALRLAGMANNNEGPGGKTLSGDKPEVDDKALRATLLWEPNDALSVLFLHHYMETEVERFDLVAGPGAGFNGPPIKASSRRGAVEQVGTNDQEIAFTSLQVSWDTADHRLVLIGGYQDLEDKFTGDLDVGNALLNYVSPQSVATDFEVTTAELRLESTGDGRVDYTLGLWYSDTETETDVAQINVGAGAFGIPADGTGIPMDDYIADVSVYVPTDAENMAIFGHIDFHVTDRLTIGAGARYLEETSKRNNVIDLGPFLNPAAVAPGVPLGTLCPDGLAGTLPPDPGFPLMFVGETFPGYCDLFLDLPPNELPIDETWTEWVYDASINYAATEDVNLYFTAAHSWRPPGVTVGITAPMPDDLIFGEPEESDSVELGVKSEWLDRRLRVNAAVYYQEFDGFIGRFEDIPFLDEPGFNVQSGGFTYNGDAMVYGFETDLSYLVAPDWTVQLMYSYQKGEYDDADVPCRDTDFDGQADNGINPSFGDWAAPRPVAFCTSDDSISNLPNWNATLQSEYILPLSGHDTEAYLRGLVNYQPDNDNFATGFERDSYTLLNLYGGVRSASGNWDITLWAKNVLDEDTVLTMGAEAKHGGVAAGYSAISVLPEREIGLTLRYAFNSN